MNRARRVASQTTADITGKIQNGNNMMAVGRLSTIERETREDKTVLVDSLGL
jgi:hypothetical protein